MMLFFFTAHLRFSAVSSRLSWTLLTITRLLHDTSALRTFFTAAHLRFWPAGSGQLSVELDPAYR